MTTFSQNTVQQVWYGDEGGALRQAPRWCLSGGNCLLSLFQFHVDPSSQVYFKEVSEADMAVEMLNGRMFGRKVWATYIYFWYFFVEPHFLKQVMEVATWDGRTKYKMEESKEEEAKRLEEWENYLKEGGEKKPLEAP